MNLIIIFIVVAVVIGFFGRKLRFGFWGYFFVSLFLTPVIGLLALIAALPRPESRERTTARR